MLQSVLESVWGHDSAPKAVFTAELTAIRDAFIIASDTPDKTYTIFSDSQNAIQAIQKYNNNNPVVKEIIIYHGFSLHQGWVVLSSQIKHIHSSHQDTPLSPFT